MTFFIPRPSHKVTKTFYVTGAQANNFTLNDLHVVGTSNATIITPNVGKNENKGWRITDSVIQGIRKWSTKWLRFEIVPKWGMRCYQMSDLIVSGCLFNGKHKEHGFYCDLDFEHGGVKLARNRFQGNHSQGVQIVGPWSRPGNSYDPALSKLGQGRAANDGLLEVTRNEFLRNGRWSFWAKKGISRPAYALSIFKCVKGLTAIVEGNTFKSKTGPFKFSGGLARSYGAFMVEFAKNVTIRHNKTDYAQPSDRPVWQIDRCSNVVAFQNDFKGGKVFLRKPQNLHWHSNTGSGHVVYHDGSKSYDLGAITGEYKFEDGVLVIDNPNA